MAIHLIQTSENGFGDEPEAFARPEAALARMRAYHAEGLDRDSEGAVVTPQRLPAFKGGVLSDSSGTRQVRWWEVEVQSSAAGTAPSSPEEAVARRDLDRRRAADLALESHDFGVEVESSGGWESSTDNDEWRCRVFLGASESESTRLTTFVVRFLPGVAEVDEAYSVG